jgi:hypothetical protein
MEELGLNLDTPYYEYKPRFQIDMIYKAYYVVSFIFFLIIIYIYNKRRNIGQNRLRREYLV